MRSLRDRVIQRMSSKENKRIFNHFKSTGSSVVFRIILQVFNAQRENIKCKQMEVRWRVQEFNFCIGFYFVIPTNENRLVRVGISHLPQNIWLEDWLSLSSFLSPSSSFLSRKGPDEASLFLPSCHALCISLSWQTTFSHWSTAKHNRHMDIKWLSWAFLYWSAYWPRARAGLETLQT